jgi:hypothetical protein
MKKLESTRILRRHVTTRKEEHETSDCSYYVSKNKDSLDLHFAIASKGGGKTAIHIEIGQSDISTILNEIALQLVDPAPMLSEAVCIASKRKTEEINRMVKTMKSLTNDVKDIEAEISEIESRVENEYVEIEKESKDEEDIDKKELWELLMDASFKLEHIKDTLEDESEQREPYVVD